MTSPGQLALLDVPPPPVPETIDLRLGSCADPEFVEAASGARLIIADPPWSYRENQAHNFAETVDDVYQTLGMGDIAAHLSSLVSVAAPRARLALWATWPTVWDWLKAAPASLGDPITGGSWHKTGGPGIGFHWLGRDEPVLMYARAGAGAVVNHREHPVPNSWVSRSGEHSEKPVEWMRLWLRRWTDPGDLVVDPYAGLGPVARACLAEGRRYLGAEIDPERHRKAIDRLALRVGIEDPDAFI